MTDWPAQGRWVPSTVVRTTSAQTSGVGTSFVARTGVGPLGFDDPMTVTAWQPPDGAAPGAYTVTKSGRVVLGGAEVTVRALGPDRSLLVWAETADLPLVSRVPVLRGLLDVGTRAGLGFMLRRLARDVEHAARR
ncbi:hypothetical protein GCM10025868_12740 [Angustibacter aerolatus]|uniref:Polyketide cyclase n=1 Tax=Angustibacter aerolatus TaxID=1162965 RepID=A0ABQ6JDZ0_9ACTN|nr:hypothetical protein GCM10025868_12740 [Angustibacter aerolatus]